MLHYQLVEIWKRMENKLLFQPFGVLGWPGVGIRGRPVPATVPIVGGMPGGVSLWRSADRGVGLWYRGRRISGVEKKCSFPFFSILFQAWWVRTGLAPVPVRSEIKTMVSIPENKHESVGVARVLGPPRRSVSGCWKRMEKNSSFPGVGVSEVVGSQKFACHPRGWS